MALAVNDNQNVGEMGAPAVTVQNLKDISQIMQHVQTMEVFVTQISDTHKVIKNEIVDAQIIHNQMQQSLIKIKRCLQRLSNLKTDIIEIKQEENYVQQQEASAEPQGEVIGEETATYDWQGGDGDDGYGDPNLENEETIPSFKCGARKRNDDAKNPEMSTEKKPKRFFKWTGFRKNSPTPS